MSEQRKRETVHASACSYGCLYIFMFLL